jgi:PAS domain S-box-containing protein
MAFESDLSRRTWPRMGLTMSDVTPIVFIVDDDASVRESLELLIRCEGWQPEIFASAQKFLDHPRVLIPNCLVLDVSLPDRNGLDLQERIAGERPGMPIIFIAGHGDVPMAVQAMKAGAVEFLTKPFNDDVLLTAIRTALERSRVALGLEARLQSQQNRVAELAAANAELQLQVGLLQHLPVSAWTLKPDGTPDFVNQVWLEYSGQTLDFVRSHPEAWMTALHPEDRETAAKSFWDGVHSGRGFAFETRSLRARDGTYRWHLQQAVVLHDAEGKVLKFVGTTTDIDDQKRAEEALRARELNLRLVIDTIPTLAWCNLPDGPNEFLNQRWHAYTGLSPEDSHGWGWQVAFHPEDLPTLMKTSQHLLTSGESGEIEARLRRHDGVYRWFLIRVEPLRDEDGKIVRWYGTSTDIDDRKRAEEKLGRSEALLAQVQGVSLTGGFSWRVDTDDVTFSEEAYRIFEFEKDTPVTLQQIASRVHPEDIPLFSERMAGARSAGSDQDYEIRLRMPNGAVKYLHTISHGIEGREGQLEIIGAAQDITRRRLSEEALNKARSELAHVSRVTSLGAMTASIAHEVNQPLSGIITNAGTCLRMLATDPPNVEGARETARRTIRDGNRMSEVITRLRALFSKKEPTTEPVNLNEAVLEVIALSIVDLQKNRVVLRPELADNLPLVAGDRVQLQQVILNLLRNGSDAMSTVEDRPRHLVIRTERDEGDRVRLTVQDAGVGFDPQAVDRLFDAFYTTKGEGMGIGLSVSRSIIERHHGRLWATLNDGPGAAFSFSIPRAPEGLARADGIRNIHAAAVSGPGAA